eukprot:COSAG02_NODE_19653_length_871_cov_0.976684_1_plen_178_part_01
MLVPLSRSWLGLLLGTRLYYDFHDAGSDDDVAFEKRMDALCREIGSRGQQQQPQQRRRQQQQPEQQEQQQSEPSEPSEAVPPSRTTPAQAHTPTAAQAPATVAHDPALMSPVSTAPPRHHQSVVGMAKASTEPSVSTGIATSGSFGEMASFFREEREAAKADRADMEVKLERQRAEME